MIIDGNATPQPAPDANDAEALELEADFAAARKSTAELHAAREALATEVEMVSRLFGWLANAIRKGAVAGATSLEVLAAANGIPLPPGALGEAAGKIAEKVIEKARGKIAGAGEPGGV